MVLEQYGALVLYLVMAGVIALGAWWFYRYLKPRIMVSTFMAALTLGVIENTANSSGIAKERFSSLVDRIEKMDYKEPSEERALDKNIEKMIKAEIDKAMKKTLKAAK